MCRTMAYVNNANNYDHVDLDVYPGYDQSQDDYSYGDEDYGEDEYDPLAPEQPPQLYIPDWNAFNAGANVAAAAANAVRGAIGNPCHGGCGGGQVMPMAMQQPPAPPPQPPIIIPPAPPQMPPTNCGGGGVIMPLMPPAPPPAPPVIIPPPAPAPPVPPPPPPTIIPFPMPAPVPPPPPPFPPVPVQPPAPPIIILPPPPPPPAIPPPPPPQKEYVFVPPQTVPPPPHFYSPPMIPPPPPPAPRPLPPNIPPPPPPVQMRPWQPPPIPYPQFPFPQMPTAPPQFFPPSQPAFCGSPYTGMLAPYNGIQSCFPSGFFPSFNATCFPGLPASPCCPPPTKGIQLPPPPVPPPVPQSESQQPQQNVIVERKKEKKRSHMCPPPPPLLIPQMIPPPAGMCTQPQPFSPSAIAANAFAAGVNAGRLGANHHDNPFLHLPQPGPLLGPPPPAHLKEMMMKKCALECGKTRHTDGTMSPCNKHPHAGKGFWTAAGQFVPLEGWDLDGPPPPDVVNFGDREHTGGIPPWKNSPLVPHCAPPCIPPCRRCRPPNYNQVSDPLGICGDDPPFWCEPVLPNTEAPLAGYERSPEHPEMVRAKQSYGGCDGRQNHFPPHVCTYHMRHRQYFGNCGPRCCPLECFLRCKDPGRQTCCLDYPSCKCRRKQGSLSSCPSDSSCDELPDNRRPNQFRTPPVLVYRCDSHGPSFWNKVCRWVFGAPSHHSLCEPDPCEVRNPNCFAPGPFIDPSTDPKRRYQHLKRYAHHMAKKWRHQGRKSRRHCDPTTFYPQNDGWECGQPTAGLTVLADKRHPPQIFINSPIKCPSVSASQASSWSSSDTCLSDNRWQRGRGAVTASRVLPLDTKGSPREVDVKRLLFEAKSGTT